MDMWDRDEPSRKYGFAGSLTIPRRLENRNGFLYQTPVLPTNIEKLEIKDNKYLEHVKAGFYKLEIEDLKSLLPKTDSYALVFIARCSSFTSSLSCLL